MKNKKKLVTTILGATVFLAAGLLTAPKATTTTKAAFAEEQNDVLFSEDFSGDVEWTDLGNPSNTQKVVSKEGKGYYQAGTANWIDIPMPQTAASNNYEFSMDMQITSGAELFFHIKGIDSTTPGNVYLDFIAAGQYLRLANYGDCDVYNNSGADQGCTDTGIVAKLAETGINLKIVVFEDVIEIFTDGVRTISTPLSAFGNNRYSARRALTKGTITGFAFDFRGNTDELILDNVAVKEAKAQSTDYVMDGVKTTNGLLPLTYQNLYQPNFRANATFEIHKTLVNDDSIHAYPNIEFLMIHPTTGAGSEEPSNGLRFQAYLDREFATPWFGGKKADWNWGGVGTEYVQGDYNGEKTTFTMNIEVYGDNIYLKSWGNNASSPVRDITTSFTELGITDRGALLGINVNNAYTNLIAFEYHGYAEQGVIDVNVSKEAVSANDTVSATAYLFGTCKTATDCVWTVDGTATDQNGLTWTGSFSTVGQHTIKYGNGTVSSAEKTITVLDRILSVSSDKASLYKGETVTLTATKEGQFDEDVTWTVNGVASTTTGDTLQITADGTVDAYTVVASANGVSSEAVTINVLASKVEISANKGSFDKSETATVTATAYGIDDPSAIEWYVNDAKLAGVTGTSASVDLSSYNGGSEVKVVAKAGEIVSNELVLTVTYNVKDSVSGNENYKTVYELPVEDAAFGSGYTKVEDADGAYYQPTSGDAGNDSSFGAFNVTSFQWTMDYDFLVPASMSGEFYIYPQMAGMDTRNPTDMVELAVAVNNENLRTYIKFHNRGLNLEESEYGTGADLTYGAGIAKKGEWNHCTVAVDTTYVAFYINGTMTFFANVPNTTVPSSGCMSMWFGGAAGYNTQAGFKNFKIGAIVEPAPAVSGVSISASKVSGNVGETFTLTANLTPYNAEAKEIQWYVNGTKIEGATSLTYAFTPSATGEYKFTCVIDGVTSAEKVITVNAGEPQGGDEEDSDTKKGCKGSIIATSAIVSLVSVLGIALASFKKKED